jgi:hypothetical protein
MQDSPYAVPTPDSPDLPPPIPPGQKKSRNTWVIVLVVAVVLCCLCSCIGIGYWMWSNGDSLMQQLQQGALIQSFI